MIRTKQEIVSMLNATYMSLGNERTKLLEQQSKLTKERQEAAEKGDLRENIGYQTATEKLQLISNRLENLIEEESAWKMFLANPNINEQVTTNFADIGNLVEIRNTRTDERISFVLVPAHMGNAGIGAVSTLSKVGRGCLSNKVGGKVVVEVVGESAIKYEIMSIK